MSLSHADTLVKLKESHPHATIAGISPDLSSSESARDAFREAATQYGCVGIWVNNAPASKARVDTFIQETLNK